jgi:hypothetical protein
MQQDDRRAGPDPLEADRRPVDGTHLADRGVFIHRPNPTPDPPSRTA